MGCVLEFYSADTILFEINCYVIPGEDPPYFLCKIDGLNFGNFGPYLLLCTTGDYYHIICYHELIIILFCFDLASFFYFPNLIR